MAMVVFLGVGNRIYTSQRIRESRVQTNCACSDDTRSPIQSDLSAAAAADPVLSVTTCSTQFASWAQVLYIYEASLRGGGCDALWQGRSQPEMPLPYTCLMSAAPRVLLACRQGTSPKTSIQFTFKHRHECWCGGRSTLVGFLESSFLSLFLHTTRADC